MTGIQGARIWHAETTRYPAQSLRSRVFQKGHIWVRSELRSPVSKRDLQLLFCRYASHRRQAVHCIETQASLSTTVNCQRAHNLPALRTMPRSMLPRRINWALALSWATIAAQAQTCSNYGTFSAGTCTDCPSGLGGEGCASLLCGNGLEQPASRPIFTIALSGNAAQGCASQCTSGWIGPTCNVPQTTTSCQAAAASGTANASDITLNTGAYVWTEGASTCDVVVRAKSLRKMVFAYADRQL